MFARLRAKAAFADTEQNVSELFYKHFQKYSHNKRLRVRTNGETFGNVQETFRKHSATLTQVTFTWDRTGIAPN